MTARAFVYPPKPRPGNKVAVVSPSAALPAVFPQPFELGMRRLTQDYGLVAVEYPTTRQLGSSPSQRAADLHAAFADDEITAVLSSIGGEDQLKVLRHLDPEILRAHPKPFFGYSDNTNLLHYLWRLGIVGYHGGAVMLQWGRAVRMHPLTDESLRRALFTHGPYELSAAATYGDKERDWAGADWADQEPYGEPAQPWSWHGPPGRVGGPTWGGSLEIIDFHLRAARYLGNVEEYAGAILFLETSEELPSATYVYRVLMGMAERGLLQQFAALVVGRAKTWSLDAPRSDDARAAYRREQRQAILQALEEYHPEAICVFDVDLGHTDPQLVIPYGGHIVVDAVERRLTVTY